MNRPNASLSGNRCWRDEDRVRRVQRRGAAWTDHGPNLQAGPRGPGESAREPESTIRRACEAARVPPAEVQHVCIGMAGASLPEAVQWAQEIIREAIPGAIIYVAGDHIIAHRAAFGISPGVLVISGTG